MVEWEILLWLSATVHPLTTTIYTLPHVKNAYSCHQSPKVSFHYCIAFKSRILSSKSSPGANEAPWVRLPEYWKYLNWRIFRKALNSRHKLSALHTANILWYDKHGKILWSHLFKKGGCYIPQQISNPDGLAAICLSRGSVCFWELFSLTLVSSHRVLVSKKTWPVFIPDKFSQPFTCAWKFRGPKTTFCFVSFLFPFSSSWYNSLKSL